MPRPPSAPGSTFVARTLRRLREDAGLTLSAVADEVNRRASWDRKLTQYTLARYENGTTVPPSVAVHELAAFFAVDEATRERMLDGSRESVRAAHTRVVLHRPHEHHFQAQINDAEQRAVSIRALAVGALLPGLVQTDPYAEVLAAGLEGEDRGRWLAHRQRTRQVIEDGRRNFEIVLTRNPVDVTWGSHAVMAEQMTRLLEVSRYEHVHLGLIPAGARIVGDFRSDSTLYRFQDGRRVVYGVQDGTAIVDDPRALDAHEQVMDEVVAAAVWGEDARAVLADLQRWHETQEAP